MLGDRNFSRLFYARLVSMFGTAMAPLAIAFGVLELTGSPAKMGIVIASQTTAQVLVLLLGGALADRSSRQRQMVFADVLAMLAQLPIEQRLIVELKIYQSLTFEEIADMQDISTNTAKTRFYTALKKLKVVSEKDHVLP